MSKIDTGSRLEFTEEQEEALKTLIYKVEVAAEAFYSASAMIKSSREAVLKFAQKIYPELVLYDFSVDHKGLYIKILGRDTDED